MDIVFENRKLKPKNDYERVKSRAFARGTIPDGCFGDRTSVYFSLMEHTEGCYYCVFVSNHGYFKSPLPCVTGIKEALFLLEKHPSCNNVKITEVF